MEQEALPTEIILNHPRQFLGHLWLEETPQPGALLDLDGKTYAVLERRHRYQLRSGKYQLHKVALYVQVAPHPAELTLLDHRWVLGDATCRYNAQSELVRCAVNPLGPCDRCRWYESCQE